MTEFEEPEPSEEARMVLRGEDFRAAAKGAPNVHRMLPEANDAEMGVLSSFLLAPIEVNALAAERGITSASFYISSHQTIFSVLVEMVDKQVKVELIALTDLLRSRKTNGVTLLDQVGGPAFVTGLFTLLPTAANAAYYMDLMESRGISREIIRVGTEHASRAYDEQDTDAAAGLLEDFERSVMSIRKIQKNKRKSMHELSTGVVESLMACQDRSGNITGLSTGFAQLDKMTDGLQPETMVVIAARPSHGKTALAMNIAEYIAIGLGKPVGVFSLEMSAQQLVHRLVCTRARVNYFQWRDGFSTADDARRISIAAQEIARAPMIIEDTSGLSIQQVRALGRRMVTENKVEAIFIDYLQLLRSQTRRGQDNRQVEVSEISNGCKAMSRELHIPVVVLAQIDRGVEKGGKSIRRPRLSDLRESGAIEQDADLVGLLVRDEMYAETEEERRELYGQAVLTVGKQRNGPLGDIELTFHKQFTLFESRRYGADAEPQRELKL